MRTVSLTILTRWRDTWASYTYPKGCARRCQSVRSLTAAEGAILLTTSMPWRQELFDL